ncbi:Gamma-aminobutyric acid receptor subunit beta-like [Armadillidium nasatum]|uniref:Gamma-aminobutyric acid receptor subunit beta-like n=1 Tax=Armadillidium nasatum TaxID=96803 RepID=A0A5N5SNX1_9CRUS|nr:Gamma-aminobutyric acid receptor subunit beta-like [Armadillidium nasatum]
MSTLIKIQEGHFIVKLPKCLLFLEIKPQIREWNHYCFTEAENVNVFIDGVLNSTHDCSLDKIFVTNQESIYFTIGWDAQITNPLSGLVADAQMFWRELSAEEVKNVSLANYESIGVDLLANLSTDENSNVEITDIPKEELLEEYIQYILLYISEKNTYHGAARVCKVRMGSLPSFSVHGKEIVTKLMSKFLSRSGMSFGSFWLNSINGSSCSIGTFTMRPLNIEISNEQCNNPRINYFCVVDKEVQYRLIGFNDDDDVIFHPVPYKIGVFESEDVYRLFMKNGQFILKDVTSDFEYYISESRDSDQLLGRYKWYKPDSSENEKENDLFWIDCDDYSDEAVSLCEIGIPPRTFYDKRLPPSSLSNYTTNITIQFELLSVLDINKDDSTLNFLIKCVLTWQDDRLEFKFLNRNESISVRNDIADQYWQPELVVNGAVHDDESKLSFKDNPGNVKAKMLEKGTLKVINSYRAMFYEGNQVLLISETSVPVTIVCEMDLFYFPFDEQACSFSVELVNDILSDIKWEKRTSNISMGTGVFHALYEIFGFEYTFIDDKEIQISIKFARNYGAFIFNTIFPCIIIVLIGILSHFLPPHDYNDRVTTTMSCLIVIATLFSQIVIHYLNLLNPN